MHEDVLPSLTFTEAARAWSQSHALHISPGTQRHYRLCINALTLFFGGLRLNEIRIDHFERYQKLRSAGEGGLSKAGASCVNHELNTLSQILMRAGLWEPIGRCYRALRLPRPKVGCALTDEEEARLLETAESNPRWQVAFCCSVLSSNTAAGPNEIRHLRLSDVSLDPPRIHIREGIKNEYRERIIPLNEDALKAVRTLLERAKQIGATQPEHYLLPHRARNGSKGFDPTRPIFSWRTVWNKLRIAAGLPHLRPYDLRHHAITLLLEDEDIAERTAIALAGHVSRQMLDTYSHVRNRPKQEAVDALSARRKKSALARSLAPALKLVNGGESSGSTADKEKSPVFVSSTALSLVKNKK